MFVEGAGLGGKGLQSCPVCGGQSFVLVEVLWPELISTWQLSPAEAEYINRQQGYCCAQCRNNLRSMALAVAITRSYAFEGTLDQFCTSPQFSKLRVIEINPAGALTPWLRKLPGHRLICYPEFDMMNLSLADGSCDLVVHSDTLEHIQYPETGLAECKRILSRTGRCIFTVPIVVDRMTRSRNGLPGSYHGRAGEGLSDLVVHSEFGADVWEWALRAGFVSCAVHSLEYPAGLALEARV